MSDGSFKVPDAEIPKLAQERAQAADQAAIAPTEAAPPSPAPTAPGAEPFPGTTPEEVELFADCIMNPIFERWDVEPLDEKELTRAGKCLAPAINRYAPWLLANHAELVVAGLFVGGVFLKRTKKKPAKAPAPNQPTAPALAAPKPPEEKKAAA